MNVGSGYTPSNSLCATVIGGVNPYAVQIYSADFVMNYMKNRHGQVQVITG